MQKKFLRTSVLTLVMGLSLLTASHAMDPDAERETSPAKIKRKIEAYQSESDMCYNLWREQTPDINGNRLLNSYLGEYTEREHERGLWGRAHEVNKKTGIHSGGCRQCSKMDQAVDAMISKKKEYDAREFNSK